jgi:hypothetical protein
MNRSINTVLSVLFTLFALYIFGGATLKPFLFALLVGMTSGMYSSIFIAGPFVVMWDKWSGKASYRASRPLSVAGTGGTSGGAEELSAPTADGSSAESAMQRQRDAAQEEKRRERRERRKSKGKSGKRRH